MECKDLATKQDIANLRRDLLHAISGSDLFDDNLDYDPDNPYEGSDLEPAAVDGGLISGPLLIKALIAVITKYGPGLLLLISQTPLIQDLLRASAGAAAQGLLDQGATNTLNQILAEAKSAAAGVAAIQDILGAESTPETAPNVNSDTPQTSTQTLTKDVAANLLNGTEQRLKDYINSHHWGTKQEILGALNTPVQTPDFTGITNALQQFKTSISQEIRTAIGSVTLPELPDVVSPIRDFVFQQHTLTRANINNITSTQGFRVDLSPVLSGIAGLGSQIGSLNPAGNIASELLSLRTSVTGAISAGYSDVTSALSSGLADIPSLGDFRTLTGHITQQHLTTRGAIGGITFPAYPDFDYQRILNGVKNGHIATREHVTAQVNGISLTGEIESLRGTVKEEGIETRKKVGNIPLDKVRGDLIKNQNGNKAVIISKVQDCCFTMDYERINAHTTSQAKSTRAEVNKAKDAVTRYIDRPDLLREIKGLPGKTLQEVNKNIDDAHKTTRKHVTDKFRDRQTKVDKEIRDNRKWVDDKYGKVPDAVGTNLFPITISVGKGRSYQLRSIPSMLQNIMGRLGLNIFPKQYITTPLDGDERKRKVKDIASLGSLLEMIGKAVYAPFYPIELPAKGFKFLEGVPDTGLPRNKILRVKNAGDYTQWLSDRMHEIPISQFGGDPDDADKYGDVYLRTCKITLRENHRNDKPEQPPFVTANGGPANYYSISLKHLKPGLTWKSFKDVFTNWQWGPYLIEAVLESRYTINFRSSDRETGVRAMKNVIAKLIDEEAIKITATYEEVHPAIRKQSKTIYPEEIIITLKKKSQTGKNPDISGAKYTTEHVRVVLWTKSPPWGTPRRLTDYQNI